MTGIPTHKAVQQSDFGIFAKEVSPFSPNRTINYVHRDDYYILGVVKSGTCHVSIDFKEYVSRQVTLSVPSPTKFTISLIQETQTFFFFL